jgi:hypothetical protein
MNIHCFHPDPRRNAQYLDNHTLKKMLIENFQMFAAVLGGYKSPSLPLKLDGTEYSTKSHTSHPCTKWVARSRANYLWLVEYTEAMWERYCRIGYKGNENVPQNIEIVRKAAQYIPEGDMTPFTNCAASKVHKVDCTSLPIHDAYARYMRIRWKMRKKEVTWTGIEGRVPKLVRDLTKNGL